MTERASFEGQVTDAGRIVVDDRERLRAALQRLRGKRVVMHLSRPKRSKTLDQLGFYHAVVLPEFAEFVGEDDLRALHYDLKDAFLPKRERTNHVTGEVVLSVPSLADVTIEQMSEYLDAVLRQAAKLGKTISPPRGSE